MSKNAIYGQFALQVAIMQNIINVNVRSHISILIRDYAKHL